ncbi:uncharacterized protein LOC9631107 isoform X3 [Selaginella moellendorffii]|nr:uncharacterized protein LOC9631107 isoform X3 [Selaginella moellendorffii]XP_024528437.1 uncharacterized protein LOC9631107 isoform X3 [Selaginella moellendorffii]|eukprot:XP_002967753.2 uncharacterized protein LOC9631107 isoform X3 [Selaginella moellendorffii]
MDKKMEDDDVANAHPFLRYIEKQWHESWEILMRGFKGFSSCSWAMQQHQEWAGLRSWRSPAAPPNERRRWGDAGPEMVATPLDHAGSFSPPPRSLAEWGALILATPRPLSKAHLTHHAYKLWCSGALPIGVAAAMDSPARPEKPQLVHPRRVPTAKVLGISPSVHMIHNLAHIELNAVDLAWDTVVRFSASGGELDSQFFADFAHVADDESRHFCWCEQQLNELGSSYGDVPAHNLLWKDCQKTSASVDARLAVIPMVQEARGLDAGPRLVERLKQLGDDRSANIVEQISQEELAHVAVGVSWFLDVCRRLECDPAARFKELMTSLNVELRGPFNHKAREAAGLPQSWYDTAMDTKLEQKPLSPQAGTISSCLPEVCSRLAIVVSSESDNLL